MKLLGYVLIFLACSFTGIYSARFYKHKLINSYEYIEMLCVISDNISLWHLALNKIYDSIKNIELERIGYLDTLRSCGLAHAYREFSVKFLFDQEHEIFCEKLGTLPLVDTLKLCENEIKRLNKILDQQKEVIEKKIKLYPALALLAGIAVIILII